MGKSIKNQIPWTKGLYHSFLDDAILTELEKKVLHARVMESDKWTITRMTLEFDAVRSTINNCISNIRKKYDYLHQLYPEKYPKRIKSKQMVDKV